MKYVYSSQHKPLDVPENIGFESILEMLRAALKQGHTVDIINTAGVSDRSRQNLYIHRAIPAAGNRYRIRRVFGSNSKSGAHGFGREVPGLLVSVAKGQSPHDVFPHETASGHITTIGSFLESLLGERMMPLGRLAPTEAPQG